MQRASSPEQVPAKKVTGRAAQWQGAQAQPLLHTRRTAAAAGEQRPLLPLWPRYEDTGTEDGEEGQDLDGRRAPGKHRERAGGDHNQPGPKPTTQPPTQPPAGRAATGGAVKGRPNMPPPSTTTPPKDMSPARASTGEPLPPREKSPARPSHDEPTRAEEEPTSTGADGPIPTTSVGGEGTTHPQLVVDLSLAGQMDVDGTFKEIAKDAAAQADEAAKRTHEEAATGSAGEASEGTGDCTDEYKVKVRESPFIPTVHLRSPQLEEIPEDWRESVCYYPGPESNGAPAEGEVFDEDVIVTAGLQVVNEPSGSSSSSKEDQLLQAMRSSFQKLQALHRARKEKLDTKMAIVDTAKAGLQERVEQTQVWFMEARQDLKASQEQLGQQWNELLLKQSDIEKAQEEVAARIAKEDGELREHRISLDTQEEDLATCEEALAAKLRGKDEEIEKLVAQQTQELEPKHKDALAALVLDHASKLKEAVDAAEAAEAAKSELAGKVEELGAELEKHSKEVTISDRNKLLSEDNDSIADLKLKLTTLEETLASSRAREKTLTKKLEDEERLLASTATEHNNYVSGVKIWTARLVDVSEKLTTQLHHRPAEHQVLPRR
nr:muscle M-line assembly protein unc-89-like [Aegilops tauschii subsp. strangulata]